MILQKKQIIKRYEKNPIITADMMPFSCLGVYNSSAVKYNNIYYMVLRAQARDLVNYFWMAQSSDGFTWEIKDKLPIHDNPDYLSYTDNQYDPRITRIADTFYITFCMHKDDARMGLVTTKDFKDFKWEGPISGVGYRNTVLFPEKINGLYTAFCRPNASGDIWLTQSPDLKFWGNDQLVLSRGKYTVGIWGEGKIGPCGTPIKTPKGWLSLFHGVQVICEYEFIYHNGVMLTDLERPWKIIRVGKEPILSPEMPYEIAGHAPNVTFASSHIVEPDGTVKIYYGGADKCQCVATTTVNLLLEAALER